MEQNFLKTESIGKLLFRMSFPMVISMFINSIYNIVDSIYLSRLGTDAITSLSIFFPVQNLSMAVSVGLGVGVNSLVSRLMGAEKLPEAEKASTQGLVLALLNSFIFILIGLFLVPVYVGFYSDSDSKVFEYAVTYGRIILCFSTPYLVYLVIEKIFQAIGWMKITMIGMLIGSITNIILDPILIFGFMGIPSLGVKGAALATILGQLLALIFFLIIYLLSDFPIRLKLEYVKLERDYIKNIYIVGFPSSVTLVLPSVLVAILNRILINFSDLAVAVLGIYYKIQTFFYLPLSGITMGLRPIASYNYGAKDYSRVISVFKMALKVGVLILGMGFLILECFPRAIMQLFTPTSELNELAKPALRIIAIGFIPSVIPLILNGIFEALGWGSQSLKLSLLRQIILLIPIAYILSLFIGINGVFWAFPIAETLTAVYSYYLILNKVLPELS